MAADKLSATEALLRRSAKSPGPGDTTATAKGGATAALLRRGPLLSAGKEQKPNVFKQAVGLVKGLPGGLVKLGTGLVSEGVRGFESGVNITDLASQEGREKIRRQMPLSYEVGASPVRTVRTLNPQDLAVDIPTGNFAKTALGKRVEQEGVLGTALATAGDVSLLAGGAGLVGRAAGAGRLAKVARLEELALDSARAANVAKTADALHGADLARAATTAHLAGDTAKVENITRAAKYLDEIESLMAKGPVSTAEKLTAGAAKVSTFGAKVSGAPAEVYTRGIPFIAGKLGVTAVGRAGFEAVAASDAGRRIVAAVESTAKRLKLDPTSREFRALYAEQVDGRYDVLARDTFKGVKAAHDLLPDDASQAAALLVMSGDAAALAPLRALDDADLTAVTKRLGDIGVSDESFKIATDYVQGTLPAEHAGRMAAAIDTFRDTVLKPAESRYVAGFGTKGRLSAKGEAQRAEQLGKETLSAPLEAVRGKYEPKRQTIAAAARRRAEGVTSKQGRTIIPGENQRMRESTAAVKALNEQQAGHVENIKALKVERAGHPKDAAKIAELDKAIKAEQRKALAARRDVKGHEAKLAKIHDSFLADKAALRRLNAREAAELAKVADSVAAQPARYRNVLTHTRAAVDELTKLRDEAETLVPGTGDLYDRLIPEIATSLKALDERGIDPTFLKGGRSTGEAPKGAVSEPRIPGRRKLASERAKTSDVLPLTFREQGKAISDEARQAVRNDFGAQLGDQMGKRGAKVASGKSGAELVEAARELGLEAFDPEAPTGRMAAKDVTPDTLFLPAQLRDSFGKYLGPDSAFEELLQAAYDPATRAWKHTVLALSPRWHVGNVFGGLMMATGGGGVSPAEMLVYGREAARRVKAGDFPAEFEGRGVFAELGTKAGAKVTSGKGLIGRSYALNEAVDNFNRTLVYMAKRERGLSHETAVKLALRAMGDYSKLSRFERRVVKRLMPFYSFQRHVTKLAFSLPVTNPVRTAWALRISEMFMDPTDELQADGRVKVGDKYVDLRAFGPIGSAIGLDPSIGKTAFSMNPLLKTGIAAVSGRSANREFQPVSRPDQKFGAPAESLLTKPVVLAGYALGQVPQSTLIRDLPDLLRGEDAARRYETGQPIEGKKKDDADLRNALARFFGVPTPEKPFVKKGK